VDKLGGGGWAWFIRLKTPTRALRRLKFLPDELSHDPQALERFRREARGLALNHPNICTSTKSTARITIFHRDGVSGRHTLKHASLPPIDCACSSACHRNRDALEAALQEIVHRDIKPPMFRHERSHAKILDFDSPKWH